MTIQVKLFGPQAQLAERTVLRVDVPVPATCASLREGLARIEPKLAPSLPRSRFAINHTYAGEDTCIEEGDEVALIGMVSGG